MEITNAFWEKRNLGVETLEVQINENDGIDEIGQRLLTLDAEYIVVKVPSERSDILIALQQKGFLYIEDMIHMVSHLEEVAYPPVVQRLRKQIVTKLMEPQDMKILKEEIEKGLFSTDRISIDPYFTQAQAANRYNGWIEDELARGTSLYKYQLKEKTIGFFGLREIGDEHYTSFLGGIYNEYRKGGIGVIVKTPDVVKEMGGKSVDTYVSSNNIVQIRSLLFNGYHIDKSMHTLVKHNLR